MIERVTGVIKKDRVHLGGVVQISRMGQLPVSAGAGCPNGSAGRARIIEQRDGMAVVEVTCACGKTTIIQCQLSE